MHCQRRHRQDHGTAIILQALHSIQAEARLETQNIRVIEVNLVMGQAMLQEDIEHRIFPLQNHQHAILTTERRHQPSKVNVAYGILEILAS